MRPWSDPPQLHSALQPCRPFYYSTSISVCARPFPFKSNVFPSRENSFWAPDNIRDITLRGRHKTDRLRMLITLNEPCSSTYFTCNSLQLEHDITTQRLYYIIISDSLCQYAIYIYKMCIMTMLSNALWGEQLATKAYLLFIGDLVKELIA